MFTEEATAMVGGVLACWQSSEGWTGALLVNKARRHSRRKSWWDPRGAMENRITSVVSSPGGLGLCSGKFIMSEPKRHCHGDGVCGGSEGCREIGAWESTHDDSSHVCVL